MAISCCHMTESSWKGKPSFAPSYIYIRIHQLGIYHHHLCFLGPVSNSDDVAKALLLQTIPHRWLNLSTSTFTKMTSHILKIILMNEEATRLCSFKMQVSHPEFDLMGRISDVSCRHEKMIFTLRSQFWLIRE